MAGRGLERVLILAHRPNVGSPRGTSPRQAPENRTESGVLAGSPHQGAGDRREGAAAAVPHAQMHRQTMARAMSKWARLG